MFVSSFTPFMQHSTIYTPFQVSKTVVTDSFVTPCHPPASWLYTKSANNKYTNKMGLLSILLFVPKSAIDFVQTGSLAHVGPKNSANRYKSIPA